MPVITMTHCEKCGAKLKPDISHYCSASGSNDLLADNGLKIQVRLENCRSQATDEYESFLVVRSKGKTQPYIFIPDGFDNEVLDEIINRIKTGGG